MSKFSGTIVLRKLAILGTGGHGKVVADTAEMCDWSNIEFFDDRWPSKTMLEHWPIKGDTQVLLSRLQEFEGVIVAIGNNSIRHSKINELLQAGANIISLSHPAAVISKYATIGRGVVVLAGVVVNASVKIGDGAILNTGCSVDHDCVLAECVHISPGARLAGEVDVGFLSWIGIGASVRQCVTIGSNVTVGAGAVIVGDTVDDVTLVGVPAKVFERTVFDDDLSRIS
ncbi:acetyltransferase [Pseudomonas sp. FSL R10-2245]|uniref:acetyltransferase n=1 Tax=Pseudomonas sp. FSL R10-2245 TaxID=2662200 RepID=UPI0021151921|nr:acetyltransferase [Pseudomonas sp. FSL R10-2245]